MKKLLMGALLGASLSASAVTVTITQTSCTLGSTQACNAADQAMQDFVDEDLPDVSLGDYGGGIANSTNFAYKGLNSDYSDIFDYFMFRVGGGIAVQGQIDEPEKAEGIGLGASVTVGVNLDLLPVSKIGPIDLSKMDLFVSFASLDQEQDLEDTNTDVELSHFAVSARYQIIDEKDIIPGTLLQWGGVHLHTGFQKSSIKGTITQKFDDQVVDLGSGQTATFGNSSAKFELESSTFSIPIEVSTFLRAGYVFTFFGGAGLDIVSGSTDVSIGANGTATGTGYTANISADESDSGEAEATNMRAFGGLQFNIPFVRMAIQMNKGLGNDLLGVNFGAKILW
ncbi:MAG: hypothetical protein ACJAS4_000959 [Bacteriovoracaceae bacterium]|jgi:hypothetical protein